MEPAERDRMMEFQHHIRQFQYLSQLVTHLTVAVSLLEHCAQEAQMWQSHETGPDRCNLSQEIDQMREQMLELRQGVWQLLQQCNQSLWNRFGAMQNHT